MKNNTKLKIISVLAIVSVCAVLYNFSNSKKSSTYKSKNEKEVSLENKTQSNENTIKKEDDLPSECDDIQNIIWIKNLNFLASDQQYDTLMSLKSKLNFELKTIDKNIYEVNLIQDTYKKTDTGFTIEAKADLLDGIINIEFKDHEFIFEIER